MDRSLLPARASLTEREAEAVATAVAWFESHSGWAPPDADELAEWLADGVCRSPDGCSVAPRGWCMHGLGSWALVLEAVDHPTN